MRLLQIIALCVLFGLLSCGRSEVYDMKFTDFKDRYEYLEKEGQELNKHLYEKWKEETDKDKKDKIFKEYFDAYREHVSDNLGISKEDLETLEKSRKRLYEDKKYDRILNSTVGELIDLQNQIEGK